MAYYIIIRSHYYGPRTGPWHLLLDESGEPLTFSSRKEADAAINPDDLNNNEYACEYKVVSDANYTSGRVQRRQNDGSSRRHTLSTD